MSLRRKRLKRHGIEYVDAELNIMPFIDVFSVLNTFLLFSAVFAAFGVVKVQVPYFSNKQTDQKPKRTLSVKVEVEKDQLVVTSSYSMPPINSERQTFRADEAGLNGVHQKLVQLRGLDPDNDVVTCFTEDDVPYELLIKVLDSIKVRRENDPVFTANEEDDSELINKNYLFPKVIMGSVVL